MPPHVVFNSNPAIRFFQNCVKSERTVRFARDFEGTWSAPARRGPRSVGISDTFWGLLERAAQKSQNNGYFCSKIEDRGAIEASRSDAIEDRGAIEASRASRSDAIEDREAMLSKHREAIEASRSDVIEDRGAIEASRSDAPGASQMMTRRGLKGEAPPARHHRAIADAPPVFFNYPHASASFIFLSHSGLGMPWHQT